MSESLSIMTRRSIAALPGQLLLEKRDDPLRLLTLTARHSDLEHHCQAQPYCKAYTEDIEGEAVRELHNIRSYGIMISPDEVT